MITVISGTNRENNNTRIFAKAYRQILTSQGQEVKYFSLEDLPLSLTVSNVFDFEKNGMQEIVETFITPANRLVVVVPEYNGSFPGIMKLMIDSVHPENFIGKKVMLTGVSSGRAGNLRGLDHLASIFNYVGSEVFSQKIAIAFIEQVVRDGKVNDKNTLNLIEDHIEKFLLF